MSGQTRRTEIKIETHEVKIIRLRAPRFSTYCESCEKMTTAVALDEAAAGCETTLTDICRRIGAGDLHLVNLTRGLPLVCGRSFGNENTPVLKASANRR
jgi:hypothetical protein